MSQTLRRKISTTAPDSGWIVKVVDGQAHHRACGGDLCCQLVSQRGLAGAVGPVDADPDGMFELQAKDPIGQEVKQFRTTHVLHCQHDRPPTQRESRSNLTLR
jgi:hypothetical protein